MPDVRYRGPAPSSWLRAALQKPDGSRGYVWRPMPNVVRVIRAVLYDSYSIEPRDPRGMTEVEIHTYLSEKAGTFVPAEFEDGVTYLMRIGQVEQDTSGKDPRYRLTVEGHIAEEDARLRPWERWWRDLKTELGTRVFWLILGAVIVAGVARIMR